MALMQQAETVKWRVGRKLGRTIYAQRGVAPSDHDLFLGMMESRALAAHVVIEHNAALQEHRDAQAR